MKKIVKFIKKKFSMRTNNDAVHTVLENDEEIRRAVIDQFKDQYVFFLYTVNEIDLSNDHINFFGRSNLNDMILIDFSDKENSVGTVKITGRNIISPDGSYDEDYNFFDSPVENILSCIKADFKIPVESRTEIQNI